MMRPADTATVSRNSASALSSPCTGLVGVGDTYALRPTASAIASMRYAWNGPTRAPRRGCCVGARNGRRRRARRTSSCSWSRARSRHGYAFLGEIVRARLSLGEPVAGLLAAGDHDERREALLVQVGGVIESRRQDRRRAAVELRGAEHDDRLRVAGIVLVRRVPDLEERHEHVERENAGDDRRDLQDATSHAIALCPPAIAPASRHAPTARARRTVANRPFGRSPRRGEARRLCEGSPRAARPGR